MRAKIIQYPKSSSQNAPLFNKKWYLEFEEDMHSLSSDALMGWTSATNTDNQVKLEFDDQESAEKYAQSWGIDYEIFKAPRKKFIKKTYAENFK
ncbi:MAG: NADH dehydrogenase ubiquinone Fe-S protein 4 [Rickettsiaceae bacterium]|nr:NADH dehydrogenase ubiquinone Fe-S protein 4 [Rickettsiaceae bacterium]